MFSTSNIALDVETARESVTSLRSVDTWTILSLLTRDATHTRETVDVNLPTAQPRFTLDLALVVGEHLPRPRFAPHSSRVCPRP